MNGISSERFHRQAIKNFANTQGFQNRSEPYHTKGVPKMQYGHRAAHRDRPHRSDRRGPSLLRSNGECPSHSASGSLGDSVGIRTQDPQLRRLLLYPTELRNPPAFVRFLLKARVCFLRHKSNTNPPTFQTPEKEILGPKQLSEPAQSRLTAVRNRSSASWSDGAPLASAASPSPLP